MVDNKTTSSGLTTGGTTRPLLVTCTPAAGRHEWADTATSAHEALVLWRRQRHTHVLADFGRLPCGTTGTQLARSLRAEDPSVLLFLLSSNVHPTQASWGRRNGAFAVVPRSSESIAACLSGWTLHSCSSSGRPLDETLLAVRHSLISALLSVGRVTPETLSMVENALATLGSGRSRLSASATDLARAIAKWIFPDDLRSTLLQCLGQVPAAALHSTVGRNGIGSMMEARGAGASLAASS